MQTKKKDTEKNSTRTSNGKMIKTETKEVYTYFAYQ